MTTLPVGFCFMPSEKDLVFHYLQRKVCGKDLPRDVVPEIVIYGDKNPWEIFDKNFKKNYYVFTTLKNTKNSKTRIDRKAGSGTWKGRQTKAVEDPQTKKISWFKKDFVFEENNKKEAAGQNTNGHWIMTEYSLAGLNGESISGVVLCRITNTKAKNPNGQQEEVAIDLDNLTANQHWTTGIHPNVLSQPSTEFKMSNKRTYWSSEEGDDQHTKKMRTSSSMPSDYNEVSGSGKDFDQGLYFPQSNLIADDHGPRVSSDQDQQYIAYDSSTSTHDMSTTILPPQPTAFGTILPQSHLIAYDQYGPRVSSDYQHSSLAYDSSMSTTVLPPPPSRFATVSWPLPPNQFATSNFNFQNFQVLDQVAMQMQQNGIPFPNTCLTPTCQSRFH